MSAHAAVWVVVAVALAGIVVATLAQLVRAAREAKRAASRGAAFAESPLLSAGDTAEASVARIQAAVERVPALVERAQAAVAVIRRGPFPPELRDAVVAVRREIAAFRAFARR